MDIFNKLQQFVPELAFCAMPSFRELHQNKCDSEFASKSKARFSRIEIKSDKIERHLIINLYYVP